MHKEIDIVSFQNVSLVRILTMECVCYVKLVCISLKTIKGNALPVEKDLKRLHQDQKKFWIVLVWFNLYFLKINIYMYEERIILFFLYGCGFDNGDNRQLLQICTKCLYVPGMYKYQPRPSCDFVR